MIDIITEAFMTSKDTRNAFYAGNKIHSKDRNEAIKYNLLAGNTKLPTPITYTVCLRKHFDHA